jgi:hypothetical protein
MSDTQDTRPLRAGEPAPWFIAATSANPQFGFASIGGIVVALLFVGSLSSPGRPGAPGCGDRLQRHLRRRGRHASRGQHGPRGPQFRSPGRPDPRAALHLGLRRRRERTVRRTLRRSGHASAVRDGRGASHRGHRRRVPGPENSSPACAPSCRRNASGGGRRPPRCSPCRASSNRRSAAP